MGVLRHILEFNAGLQGQLIPDSFESPRKARKWLKANGYVKLGSGHYGTVWGSAKNDHVVKVMHRADRCWTAFAEMAMDSSNPHFPEFYTGLIPLGNPKFFAAAMEMLVPLTRKDFYDSGLYFFVAKERLLTSITDNLVVNLSPKRRRWADQYELENPEIVAAMREVESTMHSCSMDMHGLNFLKRPATGEIVIVDPVNPRLVF